MGISERKVRAKTELRQIIIDSAMALFVTDGYEKTSIRNIAERIEYSPGTIYLYFKDKDELLFAVHNVAFNKFFEAMLPLMLTADPRQRLVQMGQIYIQFAFENPELYGLMFMDKAPMNCLENSDLAWISGEKVLSLLRNTIKLCLENQTISDLELDVYTMSIWSYIHGLTSLGIRERFCVLKDKGYDFNQMVESSLHLMLDKILPKVNN